MQVKIKLRNKNLFAKLLMDMPENATEKKLYKVEGKDDYCTFVRNKNEISFILFIAEYFRGDIVAHNAVEIKSNGKLIGLSRVKLELAQ